MSRLYSTNLLLGGVHGIVGLPAWMSVAANIHLGKAAHIAHTHHRHSEVAEKVHNILCFVPKR